MKNQLKFLVMNFFLVLLKSKIIQVKRIFISFSIAVTFFASAQNTEKSFFSDVKFKNIGPTIMSGRVVDIDVNPTNPTEFYVGYASGGVWHTSNNGTSFSPIMDTATTLNVGDIAVDWKSRTIWIGTGEVNSSRSSYAGIGILKSTNNGKSWQNMGLNDSHHISRIVINPINPNEVIVGSVGHLYTKNNERGIFKTLDGGKTWSKNLFIDDETGIIDIVVSPKNFNIQYAASWKKDRKAWDFVGNGATSGIYKSEDAGQTWRLLSNENSGFPVGEGVGRIGLAIFNDDIVYAVLDNQFKRPSKAAAHQSLGKTFAVPGDDFLQMSNKELNSVLKNHGVTEKYRAENIKHWIQNGYATPQEAAALLTNMIVEEAEVIGAEVYKTTNGGKNWSKTNSNFINDLFYTYGYYFASITVNPNDENSIYLCGVPLIKSEDGGKSFKSISQDNVHSDHHYVWVNPEQPSHLINGNDGGVNITYDDGKNWIKCNSQSMGQFYSINVDNQQPYNVYGGLQDNGVWVGSNNYDFSPEWQQTGEYPYKSIMGGDGMQTQIDSRNPNIVFTGFQFGNYYRLDRQKNTRDYIAPKSIKGEKPLRFNWQTPILLSSHNQDILYFGSNFLHRSMDQGKTWTKISDDLTFGEKKGNVAYGTLTTISESTLSFGLIYTGSDDGKIHITQNGGNTWELLSENLAQNLWISRVVASVHKKERVYATLNGYRNDDFTPYIYLSEDYGKTWKNVGLNLPKSPVNVIVEDPSNENILYIGTDNSVFISTDKGDNWQDFSTEIPNVAVHDLVIQKTAKDLLVGTHGRSIYKTSIAEVQQLKKEILDKELHIFPISAITKSANWGKTYSAWQEIKQPKVTFWVYSKNDQPADIVLESKTFSGIYQQKQQLFKGLNKIEIPLVLPAKLAEKWNKANSKSMIEKAKNDQYYLPAAEYSIAIKSQNGATNTKFEILAPAK